MLGMLVVHGLIATGAVRPAPPAVLAVPYVAQSELLCGGAAIAMIERWWGRRGVYAEEFASLVRPASGGILTTELLSATQARGWQAQAVRGSPAIVQQSLRDSVPVVALIRVGNNRYHYIVIVGWNAEQVTYHDPAIGPYVTLKVAEFLKRWSGGDDWAMLVQPAPVQVSVPATEPPVVLDSLPCRPWLDQAADAAAIDRLDDADRLLTAAATACPTEPLVLRELAGVRFRQGRQAEAMRLADEYLRRAPADALGWQLLASSRYITRDLGGALVAWNAIGRPTVDLLRIDGTEHTHFQVIADAIGTPLGSTLTPERFALAQRRIASIPALAMARVTYEAVAGGVVEVRAAVVERPRLEPVVPLLVGGALRAAARREAAVTISSPLGLGEQWNAQWRWESADPRRAIRLDIPARVGMPGVVSLESSWERYRFSGISSDERRRTTTLGFRTWLTAGLETRAGMRLDRWEGQGDFLTFSLGTDVHALHDQIVLSVHGEHAAALTDNDSYRRMRARIEWTSSAAPSTITWSTRLGADWTSAHAPLGLWPIAGGDAAREIPLRAHQFIVDDRLPTERTGRGIVHGTLAGDRTIATVGMATVGVGVFVDGARVMTPADGAAQGRSYLDAGAGLKLGLSGLRSTAIRLDIARGLLTDKRWGLSVGVERSVGMSSSLK